MSVADPRRSSHAIDKHEANSSRFNPEWVRAKTRGRWAEFWDPSSGTFKPPQSPVRKKARQQKYAWSALTMRGGPEHVPLDKCMTGDELIADLKHIAGDGTSFRYPRIEHESRALIDCLPHGRLRIVEARLLAFIAHAMLVRHRHGLVATILELGVCVGLMQTATSTAMGRLIALGFVRADATYTKFGACESQRGNLWRITQQCVDAFALEAPPPGIALPAGTVDVAKLMRRRTWTPSTTPAPAPVPAPEPTPSPGIARAATPRNPCANPDPVLTLDQNSGSFRNGHRLSPSHCDPGVSRGPSRITGAVGPETRQAETRSVSGLAERETVSTTVNGVAVPELDHDALLSNPERYARVLAERHERAAAEAKASQEAADAAVKAAKMAALDREHDDSAKRFALLELDTAKDGAS